MNVLPITYGLGYETLNINEIKVPDTMCITWDNEVVEKYEDGTLDVVIDDKNNLIGGGEVLVHLIENGTEIVRVRRKRKFVFNQSIWLT